MIKRTLYFGSPVHLNIRLAQLEIKFLEFEHKREKTGVFGNIGAKSIPIEDIGVVILDNSQIVITHDVLNSLLGNNVAVITCDEYHMPTGLLLPLEGNTIQTERFYCQIKATQPLRKQLWQQTVKSKILNQSAVLNKYGCDDFDKIRAMASQVKSGDIGNVEARAAVCYWRNLFGQIKGFTRDRYGTPPNNLLNYGYAILRAVVARSLVGSGLLPTLGIHHHNRYNAYCLADDIMEPYRPYVDDLVFEIVSQYSDFSVLTTELKSRLLSIPVMDVVVEGLRKPLMLGVGATTSSLYKCFSGEQRKIAYPVLT